MLDLRDFPGNPVEDILVHDYEIILKDPEVQIIAEVMGGSGACLYLYETCFRGWKSVCTSNKELVAEHGLELMELAKKKKVNYMFEASCGGGIPIIRALNSSLTADEIDRISGNSKRDNQFHSYGNGRKRR